MTIKEIAQLAGVSASTVSKIINNNDDSISDATRTRVLEVVKKYNYAPYSPSVRAGLRTFVLGVIFRSSMSMARLVGGMTERAGEAGYMLQILNSRDDAECERKNLLLMTTTGQVDGILWEPLGEESVAALEQLQHSRIPYITFNDPHNPSCCLDYARMAYRATNLLIDAGHREIGCLLTTGTRTASFLEGYRQCLFDHQLLFDEDLIFQEADEKLIHRIAARTVSGLVSTHFATALKLYEKALSLHYQIPYDVSLVSLKDDRREQGDFPRISSLSIPFGPFGAYLAGALIDTIEKKETEIRPFEPGLELLSKGTVDIPFSMRTRKITVIGSINMDIYLTFPALPHSGKTVSTALTASYPGGKGINQAVGAAKLGHRVCLVGRVGNDVESDQIYDTMKEYAIDCSGLMRSTNQATGRAYIFVEEKGDSMISILSGANLALTPEDIEENRYLFDHTGYCLICTEIALEVVRTACRTAQAHGVKTIVKPSACSGLGDDILRHIDILVPNLDEIYEICPRELFSSSLSEKADYLLSKGVGLVIVTLGAEGCYVKGAGIDERFPAMDFTPVDNTGAGDAFICALASYLLYGYDLRRAIRIAGYAAGFCITRQGVIPALVDKATLESYIRQKEPGVLK